MQSGGNLLQPEYQGVLAGHGGGGWQWWEVEKMMNNALLPRHIPVTFVNFPRGCWTLTSTSEGASMHIFLPEDGLEAS